LGNQFYIYATHSGSGRLWKLSPQSTQLDAGIPASEVSQARECSDEALMKIITSRDRLLVYEIFGVKSTVERTSVDWIFTHETGICSRIG
jgi:hypothetical protein